LASLGPIQRKDGAFFCLPAHPLIFSLLAIARRLNQKTAAAARRRTIARTIPIIEPVGIPCDDAALDGAAALDLPPLLFTETDGVVASVPGEELGME